MDVILEEPATLKEALIELRLLRNENEFLKRQLEVAQTFQAKMGLTLNKITVKELFEKKLLECQARDLSRSRMCSYHYAEHYFSAWCKYSGLVYADEVTRDHTHEFWAWFKLAPGITKEHIGEFSRIYIWQAIKATFQYAEERNSVIKNPFKNKVFPLSPVDDWWDDEYFYALIEAIRKYAGPSYSHRYETITRCLYTTGLRIALLLGVKHSGVRVTPDGRVFITTKCKVPKSSRIQEVTVELFNKKAKEMFLHYYEEGQGGYVLISNDTKPENYAGTFRDALRGECLKGKQIQIGLCEKAGLPYKSPHKAKHGFVTKMLEKGYTAVQICKMTGNLTPSLIEKTYNHAKMGSFRDQVKADLEDL